MTVLNIGQALSRLGWATALLGSTALAAQAAEPSEHWRPTLNFYGVTGLIDVPTGQMQPDGQMSMTVGTFAGITRTTLTFQILPRISGSFRYSNSEDINYLKYEDYSDRSFDIQFKVMDEGRYLPDVMIGLQDLAGTGLSSSEYIAASKHILPNLVVTGGLGWGRLGSYNSVGSPFGERPNLVIVEGGTFNTDQWFRGPAAFFGGVEWQPTEKLGVKVEYSSDDYGFEEGQGMFERKSPWNFGVEYQAYENLRFGAYYMFGSEFGLTAQLSFNPKNRPAGGDLGKAPYPVKVRPSYAADAEAWSDEWVKQDGASDILRKNTAKLLAETGLTLEAMAVSGDRVQLRLRNATYDAEAEAIGRAARVLTYTMPASVEVFEIVPVVRGIPASKVVLRRTDIETLENVPNAAARLRSVAGIEEVGPRPEGLTYDPDLYPRFEWSLNPYLQQELFDAYEPYRTELALRLRGRYEFAPGLIASASVTHNLTNTFNSDDLLDPESDLQHVRTDAQLYRRATDTAVEHATLSWYARPGRNLYGRVTAGYLERMFGGVSAELLWKPQHSRLALGGELNYVKQRDYSGLGFQDYDILTGHASAYYDLGKGFTAQMDVGRYLAGDWGATIALDREFANGWIIGAYATKTDISALEFGNGSFDKGIRLTVPFAWFKGQPTRQTTEMVIKPFQRDGGARLEVEDRLYETVSDYHRLGLDTQWGKVWR